MYIWIFLLTPFVFLFGIEKVIYPSEEPGETPPWLTGPLIAASAHVLPAGHYNIEPYLAASVETGFYGNDWKKNSTDHFISQTTQIFAQFGLTKWMDFQLAPSVSWNYTDHAAHWVVGDLPLVFDFQLYEEPESIPWVPALKLVIRETVPIGKYRNLDPKKSLTDAGGAGSWVTAIGIVAGRLVPISGVYNFNYRVNIFYGIPAPVHLKGFNVYGGGRGANARLFPSQTLWIDWGLELSLSQNWALALDILNVWGSATHYSGSPGVLADGSKAFLGNGPSFQCSLAPAIEYNWSANFGMIAGGWFTVTGKNSLAFYNGIIALNYYR
jgi:hypothetical protein